MPGMNEALGEVAVVGEKDESFTLGIEPADVKETRQFRRKQVEDGVARMRIVARGNEAGRLVQQKINQARRWPNEFTIDFDVIALVGLCTEIRARLPVYGNAATRDKIVAMSARTNSGRGEITIETQLTRPALSWAGR
jgi:hypothetical protein